MLEQRKEENANAQHALDTAESLLAEAMQMRAGDRTFIGQMEVQEATLAEELEELVEEPKSIDQAVAQVYRSSDMRSALIL